MAGRKSDFTLTKLDDLFSTQEQRDEEKLSKIRDIPLTEIPIPITTNGMWISTATFVPTPFITTVQTIIFTVYSKTVLPIRRLKICKIKSITEKPQEPTSHELPKGSAMTLPEFMVFLFQSKDKQTNKRGDENGLQSIDPWKRSFRG